MLRFKFKNKDGPFSAYSYSFVFRKDYPDYIDILTYDDLPGAKCWLHLIKDGIIIWREDDWMCLSPEAKNYVSKLVKLKVFL